MLIFLSHAPTQQKPRVTRFYLHSHRIFSVFLAPTLPRIMQHSHNNDGPLRKHDNNEGL